MKQSVQSTSLAGASACLILFTMSRLLCVGVDTKIM